MRRPIAATGLALALAAGWAPGALAQSPSFGLTVGANASEVSAPGANAEIGPKAGLSAGVFAEFAIGDRLAVRPELLYAQKGARESIELSTINQTIVNRYTTHYVEIPVLARLEIRDAGPVTPFALAGLAPAYRLYASSRANDRLEDVTDQVRAFDLGAVLGAGAQADTPFGTAHVDLRYTVGVLNIDDSGVDDVNRNRTLSVMTGLAIPLW